MTAEDQTRHPDASAIRDWALYGPRDSAITKLVERLAYERGMRLEDIELLITNALTVAHEEDCDGGEADLAHRND
ncbi:hypothetical protein JJJ17_18725 [Paracoccus caeni]|uniref:Uncharacterized protein n=1 Tax=Paracoccus caeni TaxID=657651 RepID=A0A934W0D2_9RHOB|nr:hypothetical protein [Paracoccus caeni]MBK4217967.1 hypothetical protein [Paracoccus caeni]